MALSALGKILLVSSACAVALSVCIGVHVCRWPSLMRVCHMETVVFALMNRAPNSAFAADDMTAQIICEMLRMAPLLKGISSLPAMNMWPPAWLRAFSLERYDALLWIARTILLARYVSIASSCVAIKSKNFLHNSIVFSVGFACWEASELRVGSSPPSTARARNRNTPQTSWINFFPALSRAGETSSPCAYCVCAP